MKPQIDVHIFVDGRESKVLIHYEDETLSNFQRRVASNIEHVCAMGHIRTESSAFREAFREAARRLQEEGELRQKQAKRKGSRKRRKG